MVLEVVQLQVRAGESAAFEAAFLEAEPILQGAAGHIGHELLRCQEVADRYLLLVRWRRLEDHTVGFRNAAQFQDWRRRLHHFYDPAPTIQHYATVAGQLGPG